MNRMNVSDPLGLAVEHALKVREAVDKLDSMIRNGRCQDAGGGDRESGLEDKGKAFTRRVKELPSLILSSGLAPALLFYLAKAEEYRLADAYNLVSKGPSAADLCKLKGELGGGEGSGYTLALAAVLDAISKLSGESIDASSPSSIARWLKRVREGGREHEFLDEIEEYLVELKRAAEALLGD